MKFRSANGKKGEATCNLAYERLQEKLLLECSDKGKPVFVFHTQDRNFTLYLTSQRTIYRGTLFDLEDAPNIESHLRPRDLYRALKFSMAVENPQIEDLPEGLFQLTETRTNPQGASYVARQIVANEKGQVVREIFYTPKAIEDVRIQRSDFKEEDFLTAGNWPDPTFAHKIVIQSQRGNQTSIVFKKLTLLSEIPESALEWKSPAGTRELVLRSFSDEPPTPVPAG